MQQCLVQVDDDISSVQECKRGQGDAVLSRFARCRLSKVCYLSSKAVPAKHAACCGLNTGRCTLLDALSPVAF